MSDHQFCLKLSLGMIDRGVVGSQIDLQLMEGEPGIRG